MVGPSDHQCDSLVSLSRIRTLVRFVYHKLGQHPIVSFLFFRDIKPHNFVLASIAHVLIDFGSAAPILPPNKDGGWKSVNFEAVLPCTLGDL
jgi:serine/threonine protein kinase